MHLCPVKELVTCPFCPCYCVVHELPWGEHIDVNAQVSFLGYLCQAGEAIASQAGILYPHFSSRRIRATRCVKDQISIPPLGSRVQTRHHRLSSTPTEGFFSGSTKLMRPRQVARVCLRFGDQCSSRRYPKMIDISWRDFWYSWLLCSPLAPPRPSVSLERRRRFRQSCYCSTPYRLPML